VIFIYQRKEDKKESAVALELAKVKSCTLGIFRRYTYI
jgi:hypothetical protein